MELDSEFYFESRCEFEEINLRWPQLNLSLAKPNSRLANSIPVQFEFGILNLIFAVTCIGLAETAMGSVKLKLVSISISISILNLVMSLF